MKNQQILQINNLLRLHKKKQKQNIDWNAKKGLCTITIWLPDYKPLGNNALPGGTKICKWGSRIHIASQSKTKI